MIESNNCSVSRYYLNKKAMEQGTRTKRKDPVSPYRLQRALKFGLGHKEIKMRDFNHMGQLSDSNSESDDVYWR